MEISRRGPSRRAEVDAFLVMDVMERANRLEAAGRRVIHMEVGQPGGGLPRAARAALEAALDAPLGYTVSLGRADLRRAIAAHAGRAYGLEVDPDRVIVTTGSSAAFQFAFLALFEQGERLAMADPSYPSYRNIARALGLEPVRLEATEETRFQPTPELLVAARRAVGSIAGLLAASPGNPTGTMLDRPALEALTAACAAEGAAFISDEIYHGLDYAGRAVSALEVSDDAVVINSFSKYFAMTGWRIGWMIVPERLVRPIERLAQNLYICPPHAAQAAALGALSAEAGVELEARKAVYRANRALLLEALPKAGLSRFAPADGAFYIYADISATGLDSADLAARLLAEEGVATTPGYDFDPVRGGAWLRLSFAGAEADIAEGAARIARFLGAL